MEKEKYKYKISVIVPIYNVEKYLEETIKSVINQSIGFKNIQLILVNDGSPDNSEKICLKYKEKYPENVVYIKKENGGVSLARNEGMKYAEGKYINFLDSDDKQSKNCYKVAYNMLEKNPHLNITIFRIRFFDKFNKVHSLDFKFKKGDRIVDLTKEPNNPFYHVTSAVIRSEIAKKYKFDTKLKISEDFKYLSEIISNSPYLGIIKSAEFNYRKRLDESSAIQTSKTKREYYFDTPKYCYEFVLDLAKKHRNLSKFYQYQIVTDLRHRLYDGDVTILNEKEKNEYIEIIRNLYSQIDNDVIINQYKHNNFDSYRALDFKYRQPIYKKLKYKEDGIYLEDDKILDYKKLELKVSIFEINNGNLEINGFFETFLNNDYDVYLKIDSKYIKMDKYNISIKKSALFCNDYKYYETHYGIKLDLKDINKIEYYIKINDNYHKLYPLYDEYSKINNMPNSYYKKDGYTITQNKNIIFVNKHKHFLFLKYLKDILLIKKDLLIIGMLIVYKLTYPFVKHNNWIVSDRFNVAGDNGEWMFKYILKNTNKKNVYFALDKNSKDYERISKVGKVLKFNSIRYYLKYLNSEVVISSHIDPYIHKPFGRKQFPMNSFINRKYVFLQHGVITQDLSSWLNKEKKNIDLFITTSNMEYKSVLSNPYMYDDNVVKLTGLPRYDNLLKNNIKEENIIALMPTWRTSLVGRLIPFSQAREYNKNFINSTYFKNYNNLINDERIINCLKQNNYKLLFCLHPSMTNQLKDFNTNNEYVDIITYANYSEIFKKSKLMISDYSSVTIDFAYLKKPLIYFQYDSDIIHKIHTIYNKNENFNFEKDGFGEIITDYDKLVNSIIENVKNGCKMSEKYKKRVDKFFKYRDNKNSQRVFKEINNMLNNQ